jgi:hypothetical protein
LKPAIPGLIFRNHFLMLPAIKLDDEMIFMADKINNMVANRFLTPKFQTHEPMCPDVVPRPVFRFSLGGS